MGQYFKIVNVSKKEFIDIDELGENNKLGYVGQGLNGIALGRLLASHGESDELWGSWFGNPDTDRFYVGAWAGDRIIIAGDMDLANTNGFETATKEDPDRNLYDMVEQESEFENVSANVFKWLSKDKRIAEMIEVRKERIRSEKNA